MAFDGITVAALCSELNSTLSGGHVNKIAQPEKDSLLITIKNNGSQYRLFISANASLPLCYLTEKNRVSPITAPNFCMLLRKYIGTARVIGITQPSLERVLRLEFEHLDDLGDIRRKFLIIELMGKHSNIILCDSEYKILDSIKHVSALVSSVREVLPGREYFIPEQEGKCDPHKLTEEFFMQEIMTKPMSVSKAISGSLTGFSYSAACHVCLLASIDPDTLPQSLSDGEMLHLYRNTSEFIEKITASDFAPVIYYKNANGHEVPDEFAAVKLLQYEEAATKSISFTSVSALLEDYYGEKDEATRIYQKTSDLRKVITNLIERNVKKADLQEKQLADTDKRDKYKVYGELITAFGYNCEPGLKKLDCNNYYTGEDISIPLDPELSAMDNAKKYFDRYSKLKRTFEAVTEQLSQTNEDISHLKSILLSLELAVTENDLAQIRTELTDYGYIKAKYSKEIAARTGKKPDKKLAQKAKPFHYRNKDGYDIYVGKNNYQNDELTFKFATGNDWWFHAKGAAGSHVILKAGDGEIPDSAYEDAARLAAHYSSEKGADKIEIDYIQKKQIKKPNAAKPGFVVYYTNYSMVIDSDISGIELIE